MTDRLAEEKVDAALEIMGEMTACDRPPYFVGHFRAETSLSVELRNGTVR